MKSLKSLKDYFFNVTCLKIQSKGFNALKWSFKPNKPSKCEPTLNIFEGFKSKRGPRLNIFEGFNALKGNPKPNKPPNKCMYHIKQQGKEEIQIKWQKLSTIHILWTGGNHKLW